jgi:hypothetical protein
MLKWGKSQRKSIRRFTTCLIIADIMILITAYIILRGL